MPAIEIKGVTKFYGRQKALNAINLEIEGGEVLGLLGPNGAGKSTLMKILAGQMLPTSGYAKIHGMEIHTDAIKLKRLVGYLPENNPLYPEMYVREYLLFVLEMYGKTRDVKKRVDRMVELTGLVSEQHKKIGALSKGYRQRVGLAQALIHDPKVLILDEPTTGLDPNQLVEIRSLISSLGKEKTVILSTHIMQEVEAICGRVVILNRGNIVANDQPAVLMEHYKNGKLYRLLLKEQISVTQFEDLPFLAEVTQTDQGEWLLRAESGHDIRESVFRFVVSKGFNILTFSEVENNIEEVFRQYTQDKAR